MRTRNLSLAGVIAVVAILEACTWHPVELGGRPSGGGPGGDASKDIFLARQNGVVEVFVDDTRVYWVTRAENQLAPPASFHSCLKDRCASTVVTYFTTPHDSPPEDVAIDSANVYWYLQGINSTPSTIESCPHAGCGQQPATVISSLDASSLASDGTFLYWTSPQENSLFQCTPGNCRATQRALAQTQANPQFLVVTGGFAYWVASDAAASNAIRRVATDGVSPMEIIAIGQNRTSSLTVREPYLYFTNSDSVGTVLRCMVTGCPSGPMVVASGLAFPTSVVADDTNAYWINLGDVPLTPDGSFAACAVTGCGAQVTTLAASESFWSAGGHAAAMDEQYIYWVVQGAAGDAVGQYGFPDAAIHRLAK